MNKRHLSSVLVLGWMLLIFYFSAQPATSSSALSSGITKSLLSQLQGVLPFLKSSDWAFWHTVVRKNAHFSAYLVLALLVHFKLKTLGIRNAKGLSLLLCVLYAMTDEFHQLFVPGRSAEIRDVFIDSAGASLGLLLTAVYEKIKH